MRASGKTRAEVQRLTYQPFGETHANTGSVDFLQRRYTGQEQDPETGLYFYNARYYNPVLGRFISPDSIVPKPGDPQSLNRYSYARNNPVLYTDPTGHFFWVAVIIGAVLGAVVGAVTSGIQSNWNLKATLLGAAIGAAAGAAGGAAGFYAFGAAGGVKAGLGAKLAAGFAGGMAAGATHGGLSAAVHRQNILVGIAQGAAIGAVTGTAMAGLYALAEYAYAGAKSLALGEPPPSGAPLEQGGPAVQGQDSPMPWAGEVPDDLKNMVLPTDRVRGCDPMGCGYYGAPRSNPLGWHGGSDFSGSVGQEVPLPFGGQRVNFGTGYNSGTQVTHPSGLFRALLIHIDPTMMRILAPPQATMTPHVHFQLEQNLSGVWYRVDPFSVFPR